MSEASHPIIQPYEGKFSSILLFGPPGVGKGSLGQFLASAGTQYHLSTGDIFRGLASYSPAGKLYYSFASKGMLLPDEATIEIWKYFVQGLIATNAYYPESQDLLLDGLPRTIKQAEMLEEYIEVRHIIVLKTSNVQELLRRLQKRVRQEGKIESVDPMVLKRRIEIYEQESSELLNYYPKHLVSHIDADQKPLEILRDVLVRLSHLLSKGPNHQGDPFVQ